MILVLILKLKEICLVVVIVKAISTMVILLFRVKFTRFLNLFLVVDNLYLFDCKCRNFDLNEVRQRFTTVRYIVNFFCR